MKNATQPYLHFGTNCREAMSFYAQVFGGDLEIMTIGESPAKEQFPAELHNQVLHSQLKNGNFWIFASDMCGMGDVVQGNSVDISLTCTTEPEIRDLYKKLSEGGIIRQELEKQFWGDLFAMVTDKFGVMWMLSLDRKS